MTEGHIRYIMWMLYHGKAEKAPARCPPVRLRPSVSLAQGPSQEMVVRGGSGVMGRRRFGAGGGMCGDLIVAPWVCVRL